MNKAFNKWIDSKKKERYFLYQIVKMSGLKWGTFRRFRKGKKIRRSTALIIHNNTGIAMEDLGFGEIEKDDWSLDLDVNVDSEFAKDADRYFSAPHRIKK